ncbi:glycine zipper domain-containing protein [Acidithiobacillus sp. IBUN Pt1247-S3]|uniref:glycine zipper domain-containing protein n=1 Tax=Acidithiobacillus sp. IBUN Pt1247-S3 TaxID=3166642 RepID=UPI0034E59F83
MKKLLGVGFATLLLAGCANSPYGNPYGYNGYGSSSPLGGSPTTTDTAAGAALGAVAGAVIGNQSGSPLSGAAIGAGLGGLAGYALSKNQQQQPSNCPPGYNCVQNAPPPSCPPGYTCNPQ